jgi:hypothetical protein
MVRPSAESATDPPKNAPLFGGFPLIVADRFHPDDDLRYIQTDPELKGALPLPDAFAKPTASTEPSCESETSDPKRVS